MTASTTKTLLKSPLVESPEIISSVAHFSGKDVRHTLELLFVCDKWQKALDLESSPDLWQLHAAECSDPEGKLLLKAAAHKLPHLVDILMMKFHEVKQEENNVLPLANVKDIDGRTPLHLIAKSRSLFSIDTARRFISLGVCIRAKDDIISVGETACHVAASTGFVELIHLLLQHDRSLAESLDESKWTPLFSAVHHGQLAAAKLLIKQHEDNETDFAFLLKHRDINGCNVFHHAAQCGSVEMLNFLCLVAVASEMKNSASTSNFEFKDDAKIEVAFRESAENQLGKLMVEKAKMTQRTPLMHAVESGKLAIVKAVARRGGVFMAEAINDVDGQGNTALMFAAKQGFADIVTYLISSFPTLNQEIRNKDRETALDIAAAFRKQDVVKILGVSSRNSTCSCCC